MNIKVLSRNFDFFFLSFSHSIAFCSLAAWCANDFRRRRTCTCFAHWLFSRRLSVAAIFLCSSILPSFESEWLVPCRFPSCLAFSAFTVCRFLYWYNGEFQPLIKFQSIQTLVPFFGELCRCAQNLCGRFSRNCCHSTKWCRRFFRLLLFSFVQKPSWLWHCCDFLKHNYSFAYRILWRLQHQLLSSSQSCVFRGEFFVHEQKMQITIPQFIHFVEVGFLVILKCNCITIDAEQKEQQFRWIFVV